MKTSDKKVAMPEAAAMPDQISETVQIIRDVLAGKENEFAKIVQKYQTKIYGMALGYTRNREAANDLVQDIFLAVFESLSRYDQSRSFTNWILKIASNHCCKYFRHHSKVRPFEEIPSNLPDPLETAIQQERREQVLRAFHSLDDEMKMVVWLYYFFDRTYDQIAEILGISLALVKIRLFRARQAMGKAFEGEARENDISKKV